MSAASTMIPVQLVINKDGAANWVSKWFDRGKWHQMSWNVAWPAAAGNTGTLSIEVTNDFSMSEDDTFASASAFAVPATIPIVHGATGVNVTAALGNAAIATSEGFARERLKYTHIGGATARSMQAIIHARQG